MAAYWLLDPAAACLTVLELVDGSYVEVAEVIGADSWTSTHPFPVTLSPARLID